jgi:hypothetical protein
VTSSAAPTASASPDLSAIENELARIEEAARYSAQSQFVQAKTWRLVNLVIGIPSAVLAAIAGGTILASTGYRALAGILALASAGLGAIVTTLNAARRAEQAHVSANSYLGLENDARVARTVDLPRLSFDDARSALKELEGRRSEINQGAEIPSWIAYWRGRRNIQRGGTRYEVDR